MTKGKRRVVSMHIEILSSRRTAFVSATCEWVMCSCNPSRQTNAVPSSLIFLEFLRLTSHMCLKEMRSVLDVYFRLYSTAMYSLTVEIKVKYCKLK